MRATYVLPIRLRRPAGDEFISYVHWLGSRVELIVVDASPPDVFAEHASRIRPAAVHVALDADVRRYANGKVAGVVTGLRRATSDRVIIADDDVRYDEGSLAAMMRALDTADVVRPQNYFDPVPWHACLDTARTLLNRVSGGDWPGTLGVRGAMLRGGYDGDVLFENLEVVRTVVAAGGREAVLFGLYVRRLPPSTTHYWSQRVRQAYDEFARPVRLFVWLALLPCAITLARTGRSSWLLAVLLLTVCAAEAGRHRANGQRVFPIAASLAAPVWLAERALCAWLALGARLLWQGVPYHGRMISRAATPLSRLKQARGTARRISV